VVEQLHPQVDPAVDCVAIDRPGAGLVTWLAGIDRVILVDALLGAADRGFSVLSADQLAAAGARIDSHRLDLAQALALAGALSQEPGEVTVYAIHIVAEDLERARPELQGTIAAVVADIAGRLRTAPSAR
jgi:hydrogenase maturation protease